MIQISVDSQKALTLFDFTDPAVASAWRAIDDRVMGGVSRSHLLADKGCAVFEGEVSDRNNGGFASVRASIPLQPSSEFEHLWLEVRGSSVACYVNLRMNNSFDGVSYRASFTVPTDWQRIEIPLVDFRPVFRGRSVSNTPAWSSADIQQLGLMVADQQLGFFKIQIRSIGLF